MAQKVDLSRQLNFLHNPAVAEEFYSPRLRYLSYSPSRNNFKLLLDEGSAFGDSTDLANSTSQLFSYFLIGLVLPNDSFWVNLRPDSPEAIIDPYLEQVDIGRIMLEADVQLKKDTALSTSPQTPEGKEYWDKLYAKAEELFGSENIIIPTLTRPWIVPGEIIIRETTEDAYIYKATLKVMLEEDYLVKAQIPNPKFQTNSNFQTSNYKQYEFKDSRLRQLNEYSSQLIRELIIPKLTEEVNSSKRYAALRQVYYSLILAQWCKQRYYGRGGHYSSLIDKKDLTGLASKIGWSKGKYFQAYQQSFKNGEYNLKDSAYTPYGQRVRSYFSGGLNLNLGFLQIMPLGRPALPAGQKIKLNSQGLIYGGSSANTGFLLGEKAVVTEFPQVGESPATAELLLPPNIIDKPAIIPASFSTLPLGYAADLGVSRNTDQASIGVVIGGLIILAAVSYMLFPILRGLLKELWQAKAVRMAVPAPEVSADANPLAPEEAADKAAFVSLMQDVRSYIPANNRLGVAVELARRLRSQGMKVEVYISNWADTGWVFFWVRCGEYILDPYALPSHQVFLIKNGTARINAYPICNEETSMETVVARLRKRWQAKIEIADYVGEGYSYWYQILPLRISSILMEAHGALQFFRHQKEKSTVGEAYVNFDRTVEKLKEVLFAMIAPKDAEKLQHFTMEWPRFIERQSKDINVLAYWITQVQSLEKLSLRERAKRLMDYIYYNREFDLRGFKLQKGVASFESLLEKMSGGISEAQPPVTGSPGTPSGNGQDSRLGGIDLRELSFVSRPAQQQFAGRDSGSVLAGGNSLEGQEALDAEFEEECRDLKRLLQAGIIPSSERLKDLLIRCCAENKLEQGKIFALRCIAEIMRMEEKRCGETESSLKETLLLLESPQSAYQLQEALSNLP